MGDEARHAIIQTRTALGPLEASTTPAPHVVTSAVPHHDVEVILSSVNSNTSMADTTKFNSSTGDAIYNYYSSADNMSSIDSGGMGRLWAEAQQEIMQARHVPP